MKATIKQKNFIFISFFASSYPALGPEYLKSTLNKYGYKSSLIYLVRFPDKVLADPRLPLPTPSEINILIKRIKQLSADFVGLSVYAHFFQFAKQLTYHIHKELDIPVIWGGIHPTLCPEECIQIADMVCIGEGEEAILELAQKISQGKDITQIRNIWVRDKDKIYKNDLRPLIQDLDSLPFPDLDSQDTYFICEDKRYRPKRQRLYSIMASRGCPHSCNYCSEVLLREMYRQKNYRRRSVENVIDELYQAKEKKNLSSFFFLDPVFPFDIKWVSAFVEDYKYKIRLPFILQFHPFEIKEQTLDLLTNAGLESLFLGLESGSERIRKDVFNRPMSNSYLIDISKLLSKPKYRHLRIAYNYIVDNPFETETDRKESIRLILQLKRPIYLRRFSLTFDPKTKITEMALDKGLISQKDLSVNKGPGVGFIKINRKRTKEEWHYLLMLDLLSTPLHFPRFMIPEKIIFLLSNLYFTKFFAEKIFKSIHYLRSLMKKIRSYIKYFSKQYLK